MNLRAARAGIVLSALGLVAAGCTPPTVLRSAGGVVYRGRFISARAYEHYARGSLAEAEGRLDEAVRAYRVTTELDSDGPEGWTRLGAVLCRQGEHDDAEDAFEEAISADSTFAPAYRERAKCALTHNDAPAALADAQLASILDPDDAATTLVHANALVKAQKVQAAARLLVARLLEPTAPRELAVRLAELAEQLKDRALATFAQDILVRDEDHADFRAPHKTSRADIDEALERGDLPGARKLATRAKTSQGEIALRAAALGRLALAKEQAELVLGADPSDGAAAIALVVAAKSGDLGAASKALSDAQATGAPALGRLLLAEVLAVRVGRDAAKDLVSADELGKPREDALEEAVRARLAVALGVPKQ